MKHLPSIKERWKQIRELIDNPRTGLKESSDTNKTRMELLGMIEEDRHAIGERVLEWVESKKREEIPETECCHCKDKPYKKNCVYCVDGVQAFPDEKAIGYNSALTDLQTFIKSELMKSH